jgi:N-acetylneuraminic acid mutarotase
MLTRKSCEVIGAHDHAPASWSAAVLCRFQHKTQRPRYTFRRNHTLALSSFSLFLTLSAFAQSTSLHWLQLPSLPDPIGFAAPFAGTSGGALILAGGANFPSAMPWDGGQKVWYDSIFVLPNPRGQWLAESKLPHALAYGVSVSTPEGVLCAGGSDAHQHFRDVFLLSWKNGQIDTRNFPPLPRPMANGCGALVGTTFYLAGGTEKPDATNALHTFWSIDISAQNPTWIQLPPWPGPARMLAVAATVTPTFLSASNATPTFLSASNVTPTSLSTNNVTPTFLSASNVTPTSPSTNNVTPTFLSASNGAFFLFSGIELSGDSASKPVRHYLKDAYRFTPREGWKRVSDLPRAAAAAPSPAIRRNGQLLIVSGDDGTQVNFEPKSKHPGFPKDVLAYELSANRWTRLADSPLSRATAPIVEWNGMAIVPNGEPKPGYRTPEVWALKLR